jgi:hypothetical protein
VALSVGKSETHERPLGVRVSDVKSDFRGKLLVDKSYSYKSQFVEQKTMAELLPYLEASFAKGVKAIKWQQYVPGFNDGDPCEFTINDVYFTSNPGMVNLWSKGESAEDLAEEYYPLRMAENLDDYAYGLYSDHPDGLTKDVDVPISSAEFEYAIRAEFGDNAEVVITPDTTYIFDYECGY